MAKKKRVKVYYEYPLGASYKKCPTARYVGGTSHYLCECKDPKTCPGWAEAQYLYGLEPVRMETTN